MNKHAIESGVNFLSFLKARLTCSADIPRKGVVTFLNPYSYLVARRNYDYFKRVDMVFCDGILLAVLMRLVGLKCRRISFDMTSLAPVVLVDAASRGDGVYFVGSEPGVADIAVSKLVKKFEGMNVSGVRDGYFSSESEKELFVSHLVKLNPEVVIVGMGTPLQEMLLVDLKESGWGGVGYTCGGFMHQTASKGAQYYPKLMNRLQMRWLYRMVDEPKLIRRYFLDYPKFLLVFLFDLMSYYCLEMSKRKVAGR